MSSILKALQRLQGDRGAGALPEPQPALGDDLARELAQTPALPEEARSLSRARLTLIGIGGAAALLVTVGLGWWLTRGPEAPPLAESPAPPVASAEPPPEPAPPPGTIRRARPARPSAPPEEAPTLPASVEPVAEAPAETAAVPVAPAETPQPAAATPRAPDAPAETPHPAAATPRAPAAPAPIAERTLPREAVPSRDVPAAVPRETAPSREPARVPAALPAPAEAAGRELAARPAPAREEAPRIELVGEAPERAAGAPANATPAHAPPPVAAAPRAEPRAGLAPPEVEVLRTIWHPKPERRVARLRVGGFAAPMEVREGDAVSTLVVKTIEPSGVVFLHGGEELRRDIGKP